MAGLLYLPRLYVYHSGSEIGSIQSETFKVMERRLLRVIMLPAMLIVFLSGFIMIYINVNLIYELYFQLKLLLVVAMGYTHGKFASMYKSFATDARFATENYFRVWNEVPTCIMILIVLLIIIKPF